MADLDFHAADDGTIQQFDDGDELELDPKTWEAYTESRVVYASRIPRPFTIEGGDVHDDAYLVSDGQRIYAVDAEVFNRNHRQALVTRDPSA